MNQAFILAPEKRICLSFFKELVQVRFLASIKVLQDCLEHAEI